MRYKMYCIFAKESLDKINGIRGKMATQAGHAYLHAFWDAEDRWAELLSFEDDLYCKHSAYRASEHAYKITLVVDTVEELKEIQKRYSNVCGTSLITDAGLTVFKEHTTTCLGLGPISEDRIGEDLKALKLLT